MGTLENRGKGSWRIGFQVSTPAGWKWIRETIHVDPSLTESKQRKQAEKALAALQTKYEDGRIAPAGHAYTVREWSEVWMDTHVRPNCSPVTYSNYRFLLDSRILPYLGDIPLRKLTPLQIADWIAQLRESPRMSTRLTPDQLSRPRSPSQKLIPSKERSKPLSSKTILHYYACLESMLAEAVRMEIIDRNPMDNVKRPKVRKPRIQTLSEERALDLLRALSDEPNMCYRTAVLLALLCGLRLGEVGELKLSDVDWQNNTIDISRALKYTPASGNIVEEPKTDAGMRIIALPDGMMQVLRSAKEYQDECRRLAPQVWRGEGWIVHAWDGAQLHHDTPSKWFRRFADRHGFVGVRFHDLRHTHASILLANNVDVVAVAKRLGHADISTTLRNYAHALDRRDRDSARIIDHLIESVTIPPMQLPHLASDSSHAPDLPEDPSPDHPIS